VTTKLSFFDR